MANDRNPNPTEPTFDVNVIARPGALLRELITRSGWRKAPYALTGGQAAR